MTVGCLVVSNLILVVLLIYTRHCGRAAEEAAIQNAADWQAEAERSRRATLKAHCGWTAARC